MTENYNADEIARQLVGVSPLVKYAIASPYEHEGAQVFIFSTKRKLFTEEMVSICRDMAAVIRREMSERPNGWAASIYANQYAGARPMGVYSIGWAGHADTWRLFEGQDWTPAYYAKFLELRDRLRSALAVAGTEGVRSPGDGDFRMATEESGRYTQAVFVCRPEFLTTDLIRTIQGVLRDGYDDWVVELTPSFGPLFQGLWEGIEVRVDGVVEKWDRQYAEQMLGDRLKI
jgi:hypothetical protein